MPTGRIEMENVNDKWVIQIEASSYMGSRRRVLSAVSLDEAITVARRNYDELSAMVQPKPPEVPIVLESEFPPLVNFKQPAVNGEQPLKRGRHKADCLCEKCVTKREAAVAAA